MKIIAVVGLVVALALLVQPAASQVPDDKLIVPGQRIGKWTLGMTVGDLLKMNGERQGISYKPLQRLPHTDMVSPDVWEHHWDRLDGFYALTVGRDSQRVIVLAIEGTKYKTANAIGPIESSQIGIEAAYGKPTAVTVADQSVLTVIFNEIGLAAWVTRPEWKTFPPGTIYTMLVFRPGTAKSIWKY